MIADKKDLRYHPLMEIVVEPKNTSQILLIIGSIDWNCDKQIEQPINLIEKYFGEVFNFFIEYNLGIQDWKELMILHGLGLRYYTVKVEFENHEPQLSMLELNDDNVISVELSHPLGSLIDFIEENPQFIYQWSQMVKSSANGI